MDNFFSAEDLELLNEELEEMEHSVVKNEDEDPEMDAAARRYQEIIWEIVLITFLVSLKYYLRIILNLVIILNSYYCI